MSFILNKQKQGEKQMTSFFKQSRKNPKQIFNQNHSQPPVQKRSLTSSSTPPPPPNSLVALVG